MDKNLLGGSTVLMLLSLLSEGDRYGYDIIRELAARSENVFQMREGSLYPVLHGWRPRLGEGLRKGGGKRQKAALLPHNLCWQKAAHRRAAAVGGVHQFGGKGDRG